jgi:hypothetical protein
MCALAFGLVQVVGEPAVKRSRRVLIVSPHFPPVNAPDHHRVRMSLPYMGEFGWEATVLAIRPDCLEGVPLDPVLEQTVPTTTPVTRVKAVPARLTRTVGFGNAALRSLPYLQSAGNRLLSGEAQTGRDPLHFRRDFDLVYFSTAQFPVTILGPIWKKRFGIPYVVDFQDLWLDDYYERTGTTPPGGEFRYGCSRLVARQFEPRVMRDVSEIISVSPAYVQTLRSRYPWLKQEQFTVLPFGAPERDFQTLESLDLKQRVFDANDGNRHWVYLGVLGSIMAPALRLLFTALRQAREAEPGRWSTVRFHFVGTSYARPERARKTAEAIAAECGVADLVEERTSRVPYFETLQALKEADALLVIGADLASYTPSKLYPYMLARRPMLAVLHEQSPAVNILQSLKAGIIVGFDSQNTKAADEQMRLALERLLDESVKGVQPEIDGKKFEQCTAREMTRKQCEVFDRAAARNAVRECEAGVDVGGP